MNFANSDRIRGQIEMLLDAQCFDSAEALCSLHLSSLNKVEDVNAIKLSPPFLELLGDIIFRKGEFKRALSYYRQSSQQKKIGNGVSNRKRSNSIENAIDGQLRFKECQCHIELKDLTTAIRELEAIPLSLRNLRINMCMGKLYRSANLKRHAISCFILVIKELPSAVEAIEALVSLGIESGELLTILDDACRESSESALYADGWLHSLSNSLILKRNYDHDKCELNLNSLLILYPKNLYLLILLGKNSMNAEKFDIAISYFKQARRIDPLAIDFMDQYGLLLVKTADETELNKLAHELLGLSSEKPIGWLLVAMYCDFKRDAEKALQFVEKAIAQDSRYAPGFRLKGQFLLANGHPEQAVIAFFQANSLEKDISSFTGLIQAYIVVGKFKDAIASAKEAIACLPRSSTAFCMMGKVLTQVPEGANEAIRAYAKALRLSPSNSTAACCMAEVLLGQGKVEEAVNCLKSVLNKKPSVELRTVLAKALSLQGLHGDAIAELHSALSMHPTDAALVTQEMDRIEILIRGNAADEAEEEVSDPGEVEGAERDVFEEEEQWEGDDGEGHFEHSGEGIRGDFDLEEQDEEEDDDEEGHGHGREQQDDSLQDREGGLLLDYDDEDMDQSLSPRGSQGSQSQSPLGSISGPTRDRGGDRDREGSSASESFYRTRDHVRNLNLQTPP